MFPDRIYAIGDIHGRADLLSVLLGRIEEDREGGAVVFLGDLIDRGPDSRGVLDLVAGHMRENADAHLVLGNHDWFLREFLFGRLSDGDRDLWVEKYGALGALRSYGVSDPAADWRATRRHLLETRPEHAGLLSAARHSLVMGPLCFVHAGLRPDIPLAEQSAKDLMWIKAEFLTHREPFDYLVVHGHTPTESGLAEVYPNRIALDTHAFKSGHLTAAAFEGGRLSHILRTVDGGPSAITIERMSAPA